MGYKLQEKSYYDLVCSGLAHCSRIVRVCLQHEGRKSTFGDLQQAGLTLGQKRVSVTRMWHSGRNLTTYSTDSMNSTPPDVYYLGGFPFILLCGFVSFISLHSLHYLWWLWFTSDLIPVFYLASFKNVSHLTSLYWTNV